MDNDEKGSSKSNISELELFAESGDVVLDPAEASRIRYVLDGI